MGLPGPLVTAKEILPKSTTGVSADAVPTALPKVIAAASAPTPRAAVVRDKRVGVSSPFTDVLPFVVTASVRGRRAARRLQLLPRKITDIHPMAEWFGTKCFVVPSSQRLGTCPGDCPGDSCRLG